MVSLNARRTHWSSHFSKQAGRYSDDEARDLDFSNERLMQQVHGVILGGLALESGMRILDAGCGLGNLGEMIGAHCSSRGKAVAVYGIDISLGMVERTRSKDFTPFTKAQFLLMDVVDIGFKRESFDCCICSECLQYTDPYEGLKALLRVTSRQLIMSIPNYHDPIIQRAIERNKGWYVVPEIDHLVGAIRRYRKCKGIGVYPLIFSDDQRTHPYKESAFIEHDKLSLAEKSEANRFVVKLQME